MSFVAKTSCHHVYARECDLECEHFPECNSTVSNAVIELSKDAEEFANLCSLTPSHTSFVTLLPSGITKYVRVTAYFTQLCHATRQPDITAESGRIIRAQLPDKMFTMPHLKKVLARVDEATRVFGINILVAPVPVFSLGDVLTLEVALPRVPVTILETPLHSS